MPRLPEHNHSLYAQVHQSQVIQIVEDHAHGLSCVYTCGRMPTHSTQAFIGSGAGLDVN